MAKNNEVSVEISLEEKAALKALTTLTKEFKSTEQNATKSIGKIDIAVGTLAANMVSKLAGTAIGAVTGGFKSLVNATTESIGAAQRQQDAINKLNAALVQNGNFTEEASNDLQNFAKELQSVTRFGDEATLEQLAFAQSMGATVDQSKSIVKAAADMSEALGMDFNSAVRNITKTLGGLKGELGESIPELGALTQAQLKAGDAIDIVAAKFRGQAQAATQTFSGALEQTQNIIGDTQESLGDLITSSPEIIKIMKGIGDIFVFAGQKIDENKEAIQSFIAEGIEGALFAGIEGAVQGFITFNDALTTTQNFMDFVADGAITVGQEIMRFAQVGIEAANAFYSAFGKDTSPLDSLNQDIQKQIELLEENKNKRMEDVAARSEENEALKAQAEEFKEFSVTTLQERLAAENEVKAAARQVDLENLKQTESEKVETTRYTLDEVAKFEAQMKAEKERKKKAEVELERQTSQQKVNLAQNAANLITTIAGEQNKAAFLLSKVAAAGQVLLADAQARAAAMAAATTAGIPTAGTATAPVFASLSSLITANTAVALGTIAAQTIQGFAQGGVVGSNVGASMGPDNRLATVRDGEMILTAEDQEQLLGGIRNGSMGGDIIVEIDGREIARAVRDQRQQGFAI